MASHAVDCDIEQGFNFRPDVQSHVGYLTALKVGDRKFEADLDCAANPEGDDSFQVVAVLSSMYWEGGLAHSFQFSGQISAPNKQEIATLIHKDLSNVEVTFQFKLYDYDPVSKAYYKSLHSNDKDLKGLVEKSAAELNLAVSSDPSMEVMSPMNFEFNIGITPEEEAQEIHLATSTDMKMVLPWGFQVG